MKEIRQKRGVGPTIDDFRRVVAEDGITWDLQELGKVWDEFDSLQRPPISKSDLEELLRTKQRAIAGFSCRYRRVIEARRYLPEERASEIELLQSGRQVLRRSRHGATLEALDRVSLTSYDGRVQRDLLETDKGKLGIVTWLKSLDRILEPDSPLGCCRLLESRVIFGESRPIVDLADDVGTFLYTVQESPVTLDGVDGLVLVASWSGSIWLDPRRGFAMVKRVDRSHRFDSTTGKLVASTRPSTSSFSDWRDLGDGIFLPFSMVMTEERDGRVNFRCTLKILEAKVVPEVEESRFVKVFPRGTAVNDETRDVTYLVGSRPSIAGLLDREAKADRRRFPFTLIAADVVAVVVLLVFAMRSKARGLRR